MKPRRATLVVLLGAASAVALLASIFATTHERIYRWWWNRKHGVPVVRTWDELRARTPVELENGEKVRLGVEATRFGAGGGILVYCLMEDMPGAPVLPSSPAKGGPLGPLLVSLRRAGEEPQSETSPSELWLYREARVDEIPFFAHPVVAAQPGRHWLDVRARSGDVLATVLLHVDPEPFHPFVPWGTPRPRPRTEPEPRHGRDGVRETEVHVSGGSAVRPAWDGWSPVRIPPDGVRTLVPTRTGPPRAERLPVLFPRKPDPALVLHGSADGSTLELAGTLAFDPALLHVRWWVDDEPHLPTSHEVAELQALAEQPVSRRNRFLVDFDPARIGAQSGDRIGVQLLYSPSGWRPLAESSELVLREARRSEAGFDSARLTNRVDFSVP